jgi:hypothetical protein
VEITFTHTGGGKDWVYVLRDDGTPLRWPWPSYGTELPRDLLHYVVETRLRIRHGFWGLVADGVNFGFVSRAAEQIHAGADPETDPDVDVDIVELVQVECVLQALDGETDADCLVLARRSCVEHDVPVPEVVTEAALGLLRAEVRDLAARWRALAAGRSLVLPYRR